jgi:two-component system sensor histidine kinase MprB
MSLRVRIALATTIALALVAIVSAVAIYLAIGNELQGQTVDTLRHIAADSRLPGPGALAGAGAGPGTPFGRPEPRGGDRLGGAQGYLQRVTPDGRVARDRGDTQPLPVDDADRAVAASGRGEVIHDDVHVGGIHLLVLTVGRGNAGALQVARPLDEVDRVLSRALTVLVVVTVLGIAVALGLGLLFARVAIRPVRRFTQEAEQIAAEPGARGRLEVTGTDEVSRLAASFNSTLDALERSLHAQQQLIADAGHELRTPIASIRANVQVLEDADRLPPEDLAALRLDIVSELDELTELLGDVIELARSTDPSSPVDDVRLDQVVRAAADRAGRRGDSDVQLQLDVSPSVVVGDPARIARAVANVIDNARKWSPPGGVVDVQVDDDGVLRVRDRGPGFPAGDLERVFDRFWRSPEARSLPGSGLGLSIVRQTAIGHGGWARAMNAADGGAIVLVSFGASSPPDGA